VLRLAIRVTRAQSELVLAELLELVPTGLEEVTLADGLVEYAVYGAPGELPSLPALRAVAGEALVEVRTDELPDDFSERWRRFHRPLVIDHRLTVRPPWEPPGGTQIDVVIDPGQAFGTGAHATTRLCLELLLTLEPEGALIDLGCGSGVLAIVATKLGWGPVCALDNDPAALAATAENARANDVQLETRRFDLRHETIPEAPAVAANLLAPLLRAWAAALTEPLPKRLIASGLLAPEADGVLAAFAARGLAQHERRTRGEWAALLLGADAGRPSRRR